jgi:hypothetical protein
MAFCRVAAALEITNYRASSCGPGHYSTEQQFRHLTAIQPMQLLC